METGNSILIVFDRPQDENTAAEVNSWYENTGVACAHKADMKARGRFRVADDYPSPGGATHLSVYEMLRPVSRSGWEKSGLEHPAAPVTMAGAYAPIFRLGEVAERPVSGVLVVLGNCTDTTREQEYHRWYNTRHVPEILATGAFYLGVRYCAVDPKPGQGSYLAMYSTDADDPVKAHLLMRSQWKEGKMTASPPPVKTLTATLCKTV